MTTIAVTALHRPPLRVCWVWIRAKLIFLVRLLRDNVVHTCKTRITHICNTRWSEMLQQFVSDFWVPHSILDYFLFVLQIFSGCHIPRWSTQRTQAHQSSIQINFMLLCENIKNIKTHILVVALKTNTPHITVNKIYLRFHRPQMMWICIWRWALRKQLFPEPFLCILSSSPLIPSSIHPSILLLQAHK